MNRSLILALAVLMLAQPSFAERKKKGDDNLTSTARVHHILALSMLVDSNAVVYALPQTVFRVALTVEQRTFTSGIYAAYAEKYIGLQANAHATSGTEYRVANAQLTAHVEADPQQLYMLQPANAKINFLSLTSEGLLLLPENFSTDASAPRSTSASKADKGLPQFTDVAVDGMFREQRTSRDTSQDASEVVTLQPKTPEERAAEAAQQIFNLRRRHIELVTGDVDNAFVGGGDGLKVAIAEIRRLEREYLALFIGTTSCKQITHTFDVLPTAATNAYPLCGFSSTQGIVSAGNGIDVTLELTHDNRYAALDTALAVPSDEGSLRLRLPEICTVRVMSDVELLRGRFRVHQLGMPVNISLTQLTE
jgi:hypothetical protein